MAYNPFNAASGIVENKRKWANAKAKGEDTKPYEEGAAAYYKELKNRQRTSRRLQKPPKPKH